MYCSSSWRRLNNVIATLFFTLLIFSSNLKAQTPEEKGEKLFKQNCTSCHALNKKVVGPALSGVEGRVPPEGGTFDSGGKRVHAGERREIAHLLRRFAGRHDLVEVLKHRLDLRRGLALDLRGHQRSAGLRDGATGAVERDVRDAVAVEPQINAALVAAGRIVPMGHAIGRRQLPAIARAFVVVEDDLLVEFGEIAGHGGRN